MSSVISGTRGTTRRPRSPDRTIPRRRVRSSTRCRCRNVAGARRANPGGLGARPLARAVRGSIEESGSQAVPRRSKYGILGDESVACAHSCWHDFHGVVRCEVAETVSGALHARPVRDAQVAQDLLDFSDLGLYTRRTEGIVTSTWTSNESPERSFGNRLMPSLSQTSGGTLPETRRVASCKEESSHAWQGRAT